MIETETHCPICGERVTKTHNRIYVGNESPKGCSNEYYVHVGNRLYKIPDELLPSGERFETKTK